MDRAKRARLESERSRERVFWSNQDQWPFDAPDHIFLGRAVNMASDKWGNTRADAIMALREHFTFGRLASFLQTHDGQFIPVPAHAWNTWDFRDWLLDCRASEMIAKPNGWHPLAAVPNLFLYVGREPFERLITGQETSDPKQPETRYAAKREKV